MANPPAGISARRPEISLRASAQRDVESAIMLTLYPMSLKYSDSVIPSRTDKGQGSQYTHVCKSTLLTFLTHAGN